MNKRKAIAQHEQLHEIMGAMYRLRETFNCGQNRFGEYGRNIRESYERQAQRFEKLTGESAPSIYRDSN